MEVKKAIYTRLDTDLIPTTKKIMTNWHVLTGAVCCGKTTIINLLAERGFQTAEETARKVIDKELNKGKQLEEIIGKDPTEKRIVEMQWDLEMGLNPDDLVFLDRALPDSITFYRLHGYNPYYFIAPCCHYGYASVFILDLLPLELDGARLENEIYTTVLDDWLARDYAALGYRVERVPVMPPDERVDFILNCIGDKWKQ
jgi:predicted ATPase